MCSSELLTHFDATVFDLTRLALRTNFFGLISTFGQREKVSYERIGQHRDFESLRDCLIDDLLKARYLKDLLFELRRLGVSLPDDSEDGFPRLVELVLRRNIHLHNRGVVDSRYLEPGENGRPRWNLDNLSLGAEATIDAAYCHRADRLGREYVHLLADWVETGAIAITSSRERKRGRES